jgi:aminoglycoside phosphotransferase (APT) family kinase protein
MVRPGEELDTRAVDAWLRTILPDLHGTPEVTQYSGGASNWTYRLKYPGHDLVLRRPPAGTKAKSAHDMAREYKIQAALAPSYPVVPQMVGLCTDPAVLGTDFYVMRRIEGLIPRTRLPDGMDLDRDGVRRLCTAMIDKLIELHGADSTPLASLGKGPGYPRRQVEGWTQRYTKAKTWNVPSFGYVARWLAERTPDDVGTCVIHNDWRFDNLVLDPGDPTRVIGVLDWELATLGDPLMDLGSALAYWVHADDPLLMRMARRQPTHLPGMLRREEVVAYYLERTGRTVRDWSFYEVFGLFRVAGIIQQIYYRYHHGQTKNPAFKRFWIFNNYFEWRCRHIIARSPK